MILLSVVLSVGLLTYTSFGIPQLLFANRKNIQLVDVDGTQVNTSVVVSNLEDAAAIDFIFEDGGMSYIYWTDISLEAIKRVSVGTGGTAGTSPTVIVSTGLMSPDGLACDWIGRKLYWTDSEVNRIEVSNLDGQMRKVLFRDGLDQPRALALYPQKGLMFWTDWGEVPKIERAGMDGDITTRQVIINTNIFWPNGLTLDYATGSKIGAFQGRLYWADGKIAYIHSCNLDGSDRREVIPNSLSHPFALTLFETSLYWTDWQTKAIYACNKTNGLDRRVISNNLYSPMDIHVFHTSRQPQSSNPCGADNGGCSHLCLLSPTEPYYHCACPTGVRRLSDNRTCADGPSQILLLVRRTDLRWVSLDTLDYTDVVIDIKDVQHAIAIDYDPVERHIYWTDDESRSIRRAFLDGSSQEIVISTDIDRPDGVAVDWIARNIYWTDTGPDRIEVARLNGSSRRILISDDLVEPRAIIVDPLGGRMYWSDWGKYGKIERANLDGSSRLVIVNVSLGWPNGLTIDYAESRIYWGDAKLDRIESCYLDGSGRQILVQNDLPHIFGLTLLGDYLYWTDWIQREVGQVHKTDGSQRRIILEQLPDLMGLKAANVTPSEGENNCSVNNGGCSHLCLNRAPPLGHVCGCPSGYELLLDVHTCVVPEAFLLYSRRSDIRRISLEASNNDAAIPLDGVKAARALDFDVADNRIYWSDMLLKSINRAFMNGTAVEHVIDSGLESPDSVVVDWIAHNLYWADSGTERIEMSHIDGSSRLVLVWENVQPHSVAVDPHHGYLYWSNWMSNPRLERSNLDGSGRRSFVNDVGRVNGITIDFDLGRLFLANVDYNIIESVSLSSGGDRQLVVSGLPHPFGLTQFRDFIYWTDWETKSIERADKFTGQNRSHVHFSPEAIMDVSIFHSSRQTGWNECGYLNGRCSHLCVAYSNSSGPSINHHCACPTHYVLAADNRTCLPPAAFLLYSQRTNVSRMVLDPGSGSMPDMQLPITNMKGVRAIDYDPVDNVVYWIDSRAKNIRRAPENSTNASVFIQNFDSMINPFDFVIDPYSRVLFWTDASSNQINAFRLNVTSIGVIVRDGQPRHIAIAAELGYLFWSSIGKSPRLERSATDGTVKMTLFNTEMATPGPVAVDVVSRRVFWADLELRRIESGDFEGGHRQVLVEFGIVIPVGLSVHGSYLYWVDRTCCGILERVNKTSGGDQITVPVSSGAGNLTDLVVVRRLAPRHPCVHNNGGCSHLCVVFGLENRRCSCPIGLALSVDEVTCTVPPTCGVDQFTCNNGVCVPSAWRCDGYGECEDDSDERECTTCSDAFFLCQPTGRCLSPQVRCNGAKDCADGSDEKNCSHCQPGEFKCKADSECISSSFVCNGRDDCNDGSDEWQCGRPDSPIDAKPSTAMPYAIGIGLFGGITVMVLFVFLVICLCRHKAREQVVLDDRHDIVMVAKESPTVTIALSDIQSGSSISMSPNNYGILPPPPSTVSVGKSRNGDVSSVSLIYDRDHITGASSSSSTTTEARLAYPKETLNPPPSPVTERSRSVAAGGRRAKGGMRAAVKAKLYKRRRKHCRMPSHPTTPCSTDVCEDSEPYLVDVGDGAYEYHIGDHGFAYESDPLCPPPPTPHSQYLSEEPSCPPSPRSTEYSFFMPFPPPPPSTVGSQDC